MKRFAVMMRWLLAGLLVLGLGACDPSQNPNLANDLMSALMNPTASSLDSATVAAGLKEALEVGTGRAVDLTAKTDGFLANELIRIGMPQQLTGMASTLRTLGMGAQVDQLETAMNRGAELAAGEARQVFVDAVKGMTISDAMGILHGGDTAATEYFRGKTESTLASRFQPIVTEKLNEVGLYRTYKPLADTYSSLPLVKTPAVDLEKYVTDKSLDGLFTMLAAEEKRIREDPAARTTELLKKVFASQ